MRKWLLPEAVEDVLPAEAARVEALRRVLLDHFRGRGYRLVQPPLVEFLESLLTGTGRDLDLLTFKTVDPQSGRMLGLRADTTPQVARIDAHLLNESGVTRLCYAGSVLRTQATGPGGTRQVLQIGAELYGHGSVAADREIVRMLLSALDAAGVRGLHVDVGHVGVYRALAQAAGLAGTGEGDDAELFVALRDKDAATVLDLTAALPEPARGALRALPNLYGPAAATLAAARDTLPQLPGVAAALEAMGVLAAAATGTVQVHVDLADLSGYHYYTGATFCVFAEDGRGAIVDCGRGGRYDGVGRAFGRARPATGFSLDLRRLAALADSSAPAPVILAPDVADPALAAAIAALRAEGEAVVIALPGEAAEGRRRLVAAGGAWHVEEN
ncbi:MAG: ATP phosphoribosyltransferase regulatory subunit [Betaproteobacteria bacterium]|nr:ATP phosphoribosyltransferase regulatory subunit [Betaproteobacteria bacterium]